MLRLVSPLNNPQNKKLKFVKIWSWHVENHHSYYRLHFEQFHYSYHNSIVDDENIYNFKINYNNNVWKIIIIHFVNAEIDLELN
jgi:hypothetical protein